MDDYVYMPSRTETALCNSCGGSGEGHSAAGNCRVCKGSGEIEIEIELETETEGEDE